MIGAGVHIIVSICLWIKKIGVNRQEQFQPCNEIAREVYLGPTATAWASRVRAWARARAIIFSRAIVFRGWSLPIDRTFDLLVP